MQQILVVEDDRELSRGLCQALTGEGRKLIPCLSLEAARQQLSCGAISLVLLDVNLPDGSGLELLEQIKSGDTASAVILLTANDTDLDIVDGLERGADDYITKPFSLSVLRARVNTQLRRTEGACSRQRLHLGRFTFDFEQLDVRVDGKRVELSKTEHKLLRLLVENRGTVLSRAALVDRIWTDGAEFVDENALSVAVKRLRDKLGAQDKIKTIYGIGYSWEKHDA